MTNYNLCFMILLFFFASNSSFAFFEESTAVNEKKLELSISNYDVLWENETGKGKVLLNIEVINQKKIYFVGELRVLVLSIGKRINFDHVYIEEMLCEESNNINCFKHKGFLQKNFEFSNTAHIIPIEISLPEKSCNSQNQLQIIVVLRGKNKINQKIVVKDSIFIK